MSSPSSLFRAVGRMRGRRVAGRGSRGAVSLGWIRRRNRFARLRHDLHRVLLDAGFGADRGILQHNRGRPLFYAGHSLSAVVSRRRYRSPILMQSRTNVNDNRTFRRLSKRSGHRQHKAVTLWPSTDYLNRKLSRDSWPMAVQPISFMSRSISVRIRSRARSTPASPAAARGKR
jgi:hypothetical protein